MPRPSSCPAILAAAVCLLAGCLGAATSVAGVVVVANRTAAAVEFDLVAPDGKSTHQRLAAQDVLPIPAEDTISVTFQSAGKTHESPLEADSVYYFIVRDGRLLLGKVALPRPSADGRWPAPPKPRAPVAPVGTIAVKVLVDDDEPAVPRLWQQRLRERIDAASKVLEHHCRVRLEVVAFGTWDSDDRTFDFARSLREFESEVDPAPARVAIGFASQYRRPEVSRVDLGGTRGPLHSHILVREWSQHVTEPERLEVLLHELGHFLGATHSPEGNSVMRPTLGDHRSHARAFRIGFDALNTLAMYLLAEELRAGRYRGFSRLEPCAKAHIRSVYMAFAEGMPEDESTRHYLRLLDARP